LELLAQRHVLVEQRRVVLLGVPAGLPGLVEPEPEPVRMDLLTHAFTSGLPARSPPCSISSTSTRRPWPPRAPSRACRASGVAPSEPAAAPARRLCPDRLPPEPSPAAAPASARGRA